MTRYLLPYAGRAAVLWLLLRAALFAASVRPDATVGGSTLADRFGLEPPVLFLAAGVTATLVLLDVAALRERTFLANLGVDRSAIAATAFGTAVALEIVVATLAPVLP